VNIERMKSLLKLLGLAGAAIVLHACASEPAPWTKSESPWDQRRDAAAEAPAADIYKADLEMPAESASEVELSYQAGSVESFAPEAAIEVEPVEAEAVITQDEMYDSAPAVGGTIMDQPAEYYTIQLIASVDIDRVYRFAEQNQISTQYVVPTVRDGVTWHVLLLDVYPDYSSAIAARDEIAPSLATQPWVRSVGSVQKLMQ